MYLLLPFGCGCGWPCHAVSVDEPVPLRAASNPSTRAGSTVTLTLSSPATIAGDS